MLHVGVRRLPLSATDKTDKTGKTYKSTGMLKPHRNLIPDQAAPNPIREGSSLENQAT